MILTGKKDDGAVISDLETWFQHGPPAGGARQWKDYRSAKELARAWLRHGHIYMPEELGELFAQSAATRGLDPEHAVAELEIPFDEFDRPRNADLALWGKNSQQVRIVATIEAKADEEFDVTIGEKLASAAKNPASNLLERISRLSQGILGQEAVPTIRQLRYQLLPALAATAKLAEEKQAALGVLVIHEFVSLTLDFDQLVQNSNDLSAFVRTIPGWGGERIETGKLLPPIRLPGSTK